AGNEVVVVVDEDEEIAGGLGDGELALLVSFVPRGAMLKITETAIKPASQGTGQGLGTVADDKDLIAGADLRLKVAEEGLEAGAADRREDQAEAKPRPVRG